MKERILNLTKFVFIPIGLVLIFELFYRDPLFNKTLVDVPLMQEKQKLKPFFSFITQIGSKVPIMMVYGVTFNIMSKPAVLYLWTTMASINYLGDLLKSIYA